MTILYKYGNFLTKNDDAKFDALHNPGESTPFSGIYRCEHCGKEATSVYSHPLPPQNHHQHTPPAPIKWRLIVWG